MKKTVTVDLAPNEILAVVEKESELPSVYFKGTYVQVNAKVAQAHMLKAGWVKKIREVS